MSSLAPALACERLTKRYGRVAALRSVNITVATGECVAVFGRNGAGKTTLLQIAGSLIRSFEGECGLNQPMMPPRNATRVGLVPRTCPHDDLSAIDNLRFFARLYRSPTTRNARKCRADRDRASTVARPPRGMKQRLRLLAYTGSDLVDGRAFMASTPASQSSSRRCAHLSATAM
jgi:ABC-type multidrug transport system ATPase subunit